MSARKYTKWFVKESDKPVRTGVYENRVKGLGSRTYAYWNGFLWGCSKMSVEQAYKEDPNYAWSTQHKIWRGLTEESK